MSRLPETITGLSRKYGFTKSAQYDHGWMFDNSMGPNPLWLVEWLTRDMLLDKEMVVLDMGCGKGLTSIFLAKEFGCTVLANDLWIAADENLERITEAGLEKKIFPIHAEAHALPYARGQFDSIICVDSYQYYGTDEMYLNYFLEFLKPGGQIGIVMPGWSKEIGGVKGKEIIGFDVKEYAGFHTLQWWKNQMMFSKLLEISQCDYLGNVKAIWRDSANAMIQTKKILRKAEGAAPAQIKKEVDFWKGDIEFLEKDTGNYASILRIIGRKR
jgi:SAM-dependent methyltransferase